MTPMLSPRLSSNVSREDTSKTAMMVVNPVAAVQVDRQSLRGSSVVVEGEMEVGRAANLKEAEVGVVRPPRGDRQ